MLHAQGMRVTVLIIWHGCGSISSIVYTSSDIGILDGSMHKVLHIVDNRLTGSTMQRYRNTEIICLANLLLPGRHYIIYRSSSDHACLT